MRTCPLWEPAYAPSRTSTSPGAALSLQSGERAFLASQRRLPEGNGAKLPERSHTDKHYMHHGIASSGAKRVHHCQRHKCGRPQESLVLQ